MKPNVILKCSMIAIFVNHKLTVSISSSQRCPTIIVQSDISISTTVGYVSQTLTVSPGSGRRFPSSADLRTASNSRSSSSNWARALSISRLLHTSWALVAELLSSANAADMTLTLEFKLMTAAWSLTVGVAALAAAISLLAGCRKIDAKLFRVQNN